MSLDNALSIANSSLANINRQIALVSHNVANANTAHYAREVAGQENLTANGVGLGVVSHASTRVTDTMLQGQSLRQTTLVTQFETTKTALQAIDPVLGKPGQGDDLPSLLGKVADGFSALLNAPDNQARQTEIVNAAGTLVRQISAIATACADQRQAAHDDIGQAVTTLNATLDTIGALSDRIVALKAGGRSTADLENQRDAALHTLASLVDVRTLEQSNGDMLIVTNGGLSLPTRGQTHRLSSANANLAPAFSRAAGTVPGLMLGGIDVTRQMQGGRIGADIALRDQGLPLFQATLDEFAAGLSRRFSDQGLALFTDATGAVPPSGGIPPQAAYVGFSVTIQVNAAVAADPSLLRDGTHAVVGDPAGATGFTPNPDTGPVGFTTLIDRILTHALGSEVATGVPHPAFATADLGPDGTLTAPFASPVTLTGMAEALTEAQARESAATASRFDTETAVQVSLDTRIAKTSGVDLDTEMAAMIALQTAFGATARIMTVVQSLFTELLQSVR